ncbi:hypothetical protein L596_017163 [Steinernema carpocapsae]|uniref:ShKT domain-containing protein n=1 Tax=Steinernema carpocapsae TaxID=34508 RepID=A0A4V6A1M9_STECR|nr:hypothetical protein L596_017163 [Steinernema carpocapsae]
MDKNLLIVFCCFGLLAVGLAEEAVVTTTTAVAGGAGAIGGGSTVATSTPPSICSDPKTGNLTHIATACEDSDMPLYCGLVNQTTSDEDRDPRCINDATFKKYCPKTCGICCTFPRHSCKNSLGDEKCAYYLDYCQSAMYRQTLASSCPATCGFCSTSGGGCRDTLDYCDKMKPYCNSKGYEAYKTACPVTCNACGSVGNGVSTGNAACQDTVKNCFTMRSKCTHPQYTYFTKVYCKRTCGFCGSAGNAVSNGNGGANVSTCKDTVKNCFTMRSKCTHPQYTYFTKVYCQRTCGFCR